MPTKTHTIHRGKSSSANTSGNGPWPKTAPMQTCIRVPDVRTAAEFYEQLGFHVVLAIPSADGRGAWASLNIDGSGFQLFGTNNRLGPSTMRDAHPTQQNRGLGVSFYVNVTDVRRIYQLAKNEKLTITNELREEFWGDRCFSVVDPYGYEWTFGQRVKDLMPNELVEAALRYDH